MGKVVLVLGASGMFGGYAARAFAAAGWEVRKYQRGTDMNAAAMGSDVIVNGLNPPKYHDWDRIIPATTAQAIAAAEASGATLLVAGNVYVYGRQAGPWGPDTPQIAASRKGAIRVASEVEYHKASQRGVQVIILRGGDFLAPEAPGSLFNIITLKDFAKGKITTMTRPDVTRAYAYLPDIGRIAVALAEKRGELGSFTDMPFAGYTLSINDVKTALERMTGRDLRIGNFPWWLMTLTSPFWELARELREMRYLYDLPHALDPQPLARMLPDFRQTPVDAVLKAHLAHLIPDQGNVSLAQTGR